ncbi:MAG: ActS/PrrB/RegB family redox-sensitive histidine kinase [Notoacmeibacter sp.]|nr:ActS/PrrB/RegB family redox-sensitive histidine kinase [Notoacmeibacter sp.]
MFEVHAPDYGYSRRLRLNTLIRLRWLAVVGQSVAVIIVAWRLEFPFPVSLCFALIGTSAWLNLFLAFRYPANYRLTELAALGILTFDVLQLSGLLYMTGGMTNPFAMLLIAPVIISATSLPVRHTLFLASLDVAAATLLVFFHEALPWYPGDPLSIPFIYIVGMWMAVVSSLVFTGMYAFRVASEARLLADALSATELVLQREQHLSALDGLAAATAHELGTPLATIALVAREMERDLPDDDKLREDVALLRSQSERCRGILRRLTSLPSEGEKHIARMPLTSLIDEVSAPHREFGIEIVLEPGECVGPEPVWRRNPGIMYGLGNLVENAVDFARNTVHVRWNWNEDKIRVLIIDDGPGYPPEILDRIGEPYTTTRGTGEATGLGGGLGLGLFIAKTLLERSGAEIAFANSTKPGLGAQVTIAWPRKALEFDEAEAFKPELLDGSGI